MAIVGGGLSGLAAAYYLKDLKVVLLEKEDDPGGKARREWFDPQPKHFPYPLGAVYTGKPYGLIQKLFRELGIRPLRFKRPIHAFWKDGRVIEEWISEEGMSKFPYPPEVLVRLREFMRKLDEVESKPGLSIPVQDSDPERLVEYDRMSFWDYVEKNFGGEAAELADYHAQDVFGTGAREVSAALGLMYMGSEITDSYSWPGGLGAIGEALSRNLGSRVRVAALVNRVEPKEGSVRVFYLRDGHPSGLEAKAVVLAVPAMVSRRIVSGLSPQKEKALAGVRYSSYVLVPMLFTKPIYRDSFVLWVPGRSFLDLTFGGGDRLEGYSVGAPGQVAVAYMPIGSSNKLRRWVLSATNEEIQKRVLKVLEVVLPGASSQLKEARVVRWGHAMPIMGPGYFTEVQPKIARPEGRLFFAGVETQVPDVGGALYSGYYAAQQVRKFLGGGGQK